MSLFGGVIPIEKITFLVFCVFSILAIGYALGRIIIKGVSLGSAGVFIVALVFGCLFYGDLEAQLPDYTTNALKIVENLGLILFVSSVGFIAGGARFVQEFKIDYFVYGVVMTILPMIIGFIFAKYILKINVLSTLGSITGGMTSTPALGTLIHVAGTEDVAAAYAATYPIALVAVVFVAQFIIILF
ncbi:MAG: hypothetical protein IJD91_03785 [Clostridia bacterium]|nr:hypothetical protein [Clostridia bacterium]